MAASGTVSSRFASRIDTVHLPKVFSRRLGGDCSLRNVGSRLARANGPNSRKTYIVTRDAVHILIGLYRFPSVSSRAQRAICRIKKVHFSGRYQN